MIENQNEAGGAICGRCGGTGYIYLQEDGMERAARCACRQRPDSDRLASLCVPPRFRHCAFEDFHDKADQLNDCRGFLPLDNDSLLMAKGKAKKFVEAFPSDRRGLLFMGRCGVGKTHLAVAILKELSKTKGVSGRFCDFHELLRQIKNSYNPVSGTTEMDLLQPICNAEVLVLDDLGAEKPSPWVLDTLHFVVNQRYLRQLTTLITTNFLDQPARHASEETLAERIGYRLRSRLFEMCHKVLMEGRDFREDLSGI